MSSSYNQFVKQLNLTGREYADGFTVQHFINLTKNEMTSVSKLLEERALEGDVIAINGLRYLDKDMALKILDRLLTNNSIKAMAIAQAALEAYNISGVPKYLDTLIEQAELSKDHEKWFCAQLLCSVQFGLNWNEGIEKRFITLLKQEPDEILRHSLAQKTLMESGYEKGSEQYKKRIQKLINSDFRD